MQAAAAHATVLAVLDESGAVQHAQVLADRGQGHAEGLCQLADGCFAQGQPGQDSAARRVGQGAEGGVERGRRLPMLNHMV